MKLIGLPAVTWYERSPLILSQLNLAMQRVLVSTPFVVYADKRDADPVGSEGLEFRCQEKTIAKRYDDNERDDTAWDTSGQEMGDTQVTLSCVSIFHHDCRCFSTSAVYL